MPAKQGCECGEESSGPDGGGPDPALDRLDTDCGHFVAVHVAAVHPGRGGVPLAGGLTPLPPFLRKDRLNKGLAVYRQLRRSELRGERGGQETIVCQDECVLVKDGGTVSTKGMVSGFGGQ